MVCANKIHIGEQGWKALPEPGIASFFCPGARIQAPHSARISHDDNPVANTPADSCSGRWGHGISTLIRDTCLARVGASCKRRDFDENRV